MTNTKIFNKLINIKKNDCELLFTVYVFFSYIITIFNSLVRSIISKTYKIDTLLLYVFFVLLFFFMLREFIRRITLWHIVSIFMIIFVLTISLLFSIDPSTNAKVIIEILIKCIPSFLLAGTVRDFQKLKKYFSKVSHLVPWGYIFMIFVLKKSLLLDSNTYEQSISYLLLLPTIVLMGEIIEHFSFKTLIPLSLGTLIMLSYGARGPFICLLLYMFVKIFFMSNKNNRSNITSISIVAICIYTYMFFFNILATILEFFETLGFSTRVINGLINASFFEDVSRQNIYKLCLERILSNPIVGTGIINDRIYISRVLFSGANPVGYYPHNIILEILMQFGIFIGIGILVSLILFISRLLLSKNVSNDSKNIVLIYIGIGFFPLLFSGSYISEEQFYILLAICLTINLKNKKIR